mmetsp:Transcript_53344/g.147780  ORF Transcript_53344/g.147780 Transcript_53344/m.147780 type:complete len:295 (-) Transcript_53344:186-1070(-)|eukprot:CAMPEP_0119527834 /NCGR_PEP_ID=MMETSP1344-20130328/42155_1 /TAXON_ID=236787 /ORGANISM="Florenciella parvula, Strain CCMP2471" /LENGTH=294 /DNA_ID=CAMNT_0007567091 /DNA_START=217 /DNA_END=1101 /DNA_ORIENTATION=+
MPGVRNRKRSRSLRSSTTSGSSSSSANSANSSGRKVARRTGTGTKHAPVTREVAEQEYEQYADLTEREIGRMKHGRQYMRYLRTGVKAEVISVKGFSHTERAVSEIHETRRQPSGIPPGVFVTEKVVLCSSGDGACHHLMALALGRSVPKLAMINKARPTAPLRANVDVGDMIKALRLEGSNLTMIRRADLQFFSHIVNEPYGMFVGTGDIEHEVRGATTTDPHCFSYDAGRRVLFDRPDNLILLDDTDMTGPGATRLFYKRGKEDGYPNLGWKVLKQVWQVVYDTRQVNEGSR